MIMMTMILMIFNDDDDDEDDDDDDADDDHTVLVQSRIVRVISAVSYNTISTCDYTYTTQARRPHRWPVTAANTRSWPSSRCCSSHARAHTHDTQAHMLTHHNRQSQCSLVLVAVLSHQYECSLPQHQCRAVASQDRGQAPGDAGPHALRTRAKGARRAQHRTQRGPAESGR